MGNAQEPILVLPNIWLFANAAQYPAYLDHDDCTILGSLAAFLGGDPDVLVPAWRSMDLNLHEIPADLPEKLRGAQLQAESARLIPGDRSATWRSWLRSSMHASEYFEHADGRRQAATTFETHCANRLRRCEIGGTCTSTCLTGLLPDFQSASLMMG